MSSRRRASMRSSLLDTRRVAAMTSATADLGSTFAMQHIRGARVLVTGAGGSIGSELTRQIAQLEPDHLSLVDSSEYNLYKVASAMQHANVGSWRALLGDVRDVSSMRHIFLNERPQIVFHSAALKHVPLLEDINVVEAVRTNVIGTKIVLDLCNANGATFVLISTDKAVNPSSQMGLTKRAAEIYVHDRALRHPEQRISIVRFGNVIGSSGSVVPLFKEQIAAGGPVTVTHPEMTRFVMTVDQAVRLALAACSLPQRGFAMYVLNMGKPVRILDLAVAMIEAAGHRPFTDIGIRFVGIRPGEKLNEELHYAWESLTPTSLADVQAAQPAFDPAPRMAPFDEVLAAADARNPEWVKRSLLQLVPEHVTSDRTLMDGSAVKVEPRLALRRAGRSSDFVHRLHAAMQV